MAEIKCGFCDTAKEKLIKSPINDAMICFDCVGGIDKMFKTPEMDQKVIPLRN